MTEQIQKPSQSLFDTDKFYNVESLLQRKNRTCQINQETTGNKPYRNPEQSENFYKTRFVFLANYNLKPHLSKVQIKGQNRMKIIKIPDEKKAWFQEKKEIQRIDKLSLQETEKWEKEILNYFVKPKQGLIDFD